MDTVPEDCAAAAEFGPGTVAEWVGWHLIAKTGIGIAFGMGIGWLLAKVAFRAPHRSLRLAEQGDPLLALAASLIAYGAAEVVAETGSWRSSRVR